MFNELKEQSFYKRTTKHLNNLIEQDHRHIKRRFVKSAGFQTLRYTARTIKGIETIHSIISNYCLKPIIRYL